MENTDLEQRISIDGVYISPCDCDSSFYTACTFYSNGLFLSATTDSITDEFLSSFNQNGSRIAQASARWGVYKLTGDTIQTQTIHKIGNGYVVFRDFLIMPDKSLINISDYVEAEYSNLAYMKNYPSFFKNSCANSAKFIKLETRRDSIDCPFINQKQFFKNKYD